MKANQSSTTDFQDYVPEEEFKEKKTTDRRRLMYGVGLVIAIVVIIVICLASSFNCKISILNNLIPGCNIGPGRFDPPILTKTFSPNSIAKNEITTLTFRLQNLNSVDLTGVTFTDALPFGLQVDDLPMATTTCAGEPTWAPPAGTTTLVFGAPSGGTILANASCSVSVNIKGTVPGVYQSVSGYVSSANGGVNMEGSGVATASITVTDLPTPEPPIVVTPLVVDEVFVPDQISSSSTSTLTFHITNSNSDLTLTGITFSNNYPDGLTNATPLTTTNTCGGLLTTDAGGSYLSLNDGVISAGSTCTISVNVTALTDGTYENASVAVSSANGGVGSVVPDTLYVGASRPPSTIEFLKEVSTSVDGPWGKFISVNPGASIHYRFIIENNGIGPFYQFQVADPAVNTADCSWPDALPIGISATCVVGPIVAESGIHANTATASGTYADKPYTTAPSTATYVAISQTSLDLYLPDDQQKFSSQIQGQLDMFNGANGGVVINIKYYSDAQSLTEGNANGVIALLSRDVIDFAQQELLLPVSVPSGQTYLEDALARSKVQDQLFAYPWQREICSTNYLNLSVSAQLPADAVGMANKLGAFLTNEANQRSNFKAWQIYPTLNGFYRTESTILPEVSCNAVDEQATKRAKELSNVLFENFGTDIKIEPDLAKGLDTTTIGGTPGGVAGTITPVTDGNQKYEGREVMGIFSINNNLLTLDMLNLINKGALQTIPLPMGNYILACTVGPNKDCLAVSIDQGIEYQIDPNIISDEETLVPANVPYALYEPGSIRKCFYVFKRRICIRVF